MDRRLEERTDPEIMEELGRRLRSVRKTSGLTIEEAAERANLNPSTVSRAEKGENPTLLTIVRMLRVYHRLEGLEAFIAPAEISPLALVRSARSRGASSDG